jgi:hypothetical protein
MNTRQDAIKWMAANGNVVDLFLKFADQMLERKRRFGINLLRERVRWETVYSYDDHEYKFCNTFSPYVARHLIHLRPELKTYMRFKLVKE